MTKCMNVETLYYANISKRFMQNNLHGSSGVNMRNCVLQTYCVRKTWKYFIR